MRSFIFVAVFTLGAPAAFSFSNLQNAIPNGDRFRCGTCHISSQGGEGWNAFGLDLLIDGGATPAQNPGNQNSGWSGPIRWQNLCALDSDNDTFTNGQELGDPDCLWRLGDAFPIVPNITAPHDAESFPTPCPNGVREDDEDCDFEDLDGQSCQTLGFSGGTLRCTFECAFSTNRCFTCGDGVIEIGEACDDGNVVSGDGCSECSVDQNFECDFEPSVCTSTLDAGPIDVANVVDAVASDALGAADVSGVDAELIADSQSGVDVTRVDGGVGPDAGSIDAGPADAGETEEAEKCSCHAATKKTPWMGAFLIAVLCSAAFIKRR